MDKLEEELRDALRPHIPPPRRSERLRQKRVRKLQEKRILLIDQIDAEGGMRHAPFDVDLRNVDIRRKHKR